MPEMREAERSIVKYVQEKQFNDETECLKRNQDIVTVILSQRAKGGSVQRGSSIFGLDAVLVNGMLVVLVDGCGMLRCLKMLNIKSFCLKTTCYELDSAALSFCIWSFGERICSVTFTK